MNLDLEGNDITKIEGYTAKMWEMFPNLAILDGKNKEGEEIMSQESDEEGEYGGEDGEDEDDFDQQEYLDKISKQLTEEQKKELEKQGLTVEQYLEGQGEDFEDMEEEGEE